MRTLRLLISAVLFLAVGLGTPLHVAMAHEPMPAVTMVMAAHQAPQPGCCDHRHGTQGMGTSCDMACAAAVAVLNPPLDAPGRFVFAVGFELNPRRAVAGIVLALDPFPPRSTRIV